MFKSASFRGAAFLLAVSLGAVSSAAPRAEMTVEQFLQTSEVLQKRGMLALLSPSYKKLQSELRVAARAWREHVPHAKPAVCLPPPSQAQLSEKDILAMFRAVPVAQRGRTTVRAAFSNAMDQRYRCR